MTDFNWWVYILLAIPGIFIFVMNWAAFIHNMRGKKFVSCIPLIGGVWIAAVCLLSPVKWIAFAGLADPGVWMLIAALIREFIPIPHREKDENKVSDN